MPVPTNPFNRPAGSTSTPPPPPAYRSVPPAPSNAPVTYSSLSDLNRNRPVPQPPTASGFTYTPDASRSGYRTGFDNPPEGVSGGAGRRTMPPAPSNYGVEVPREPPRRTVPARPDVPAPPTTGTSRFQQAQTTAAGYIPNSVSATAMSLGDRVKGGFDGIATQQRKEQVTAGAGKVAAGAAKLAGKAAWQLGKFASSSK